MGLGLSRTINKLSDLPRNKQASLYTRNRSFVPSGPGRNRYGQKESTFFTVPVENDDYRRDVSICIKTAKQRLATRSKSRGDGRIRSKFIIAHTKEEQLEAKQQAQREAQQQARQEAQEKRLALLAQLTASNRVLGPSRETASPPSHSPFSFPINPDRVGEEEGEEIGGRYPKKHAPAPAPVPEIQQQQPQPQPQQGQQQQQQQQQQGQQQQQQGPSQQQQGPSQQRQTQPSQLREPVGAAPTKVRGLLGNIFNKPSTGGGQRRKTVSRRPVRASKRKNRK